MPTNKQKWFTEAIRKSDYISKTTAYEEWKKLNPNIRLSITGFRARTSGYWRKYFIEVYGSKTHYINKNNIHKLTLDKQYYL